MSGFSLRQAFSDIGAAPRRVWLATTMMAALSQLPAVATGIVMQSGGPVSNGSVWLVSLSIVLVSAITVLLPTVATARWVEAPALLPALGRALGPALVVAAGLLALNKVMDGQIQGPAWLRLAIDVGVGAALIFVLLRGSLWFTLLALPGATPMAALRDSFRRTGPVGFRLLVFWLALGVLIILFSIPLTLVLNAIAERMQAAAPVLIILIALGSFVISAVMAVAAAAVHLQLAGEMRS